MADELLDQLPLTLLLALQDAMADPSEQGRERAAQRAANAGMYIHCMGAPENDRPPRIMSTPIPMEPAPEDGAEAATEVLRFDSPQSSSSSSS